MEIFTFDVSKSFLQSTVALQSGIVFTPSNALCNLIQKRSLNSGQSRKRKKIGTQPGNLQRASLEVDLL